MTPAYRVFLWDRHRAKQLLMNVPEYRAWRRKEGISDMSLCEFMVFAHPEDIVPMPSKKAANHKGWLGKLFG